MTKIEKVLLPFDEKGNDPSAHRKDPDIWEKVEVKPPESGPHYTREGFEDRAAAQAGDAQESKAEAAISRILNASLRNPDELARVKARIANTKWFMPGLAAFGEITHFYGPTGSGKTLLWVALLLKRLTPEQRSQVIYLNFDDSLPGGPEKMEILTDVEMITKGEAEAWIDELLETGGWLKDKIIILDTMKKFANMIQKDSVKKMFVLLRKMINEGATIISLGHTNKHLNESGELVFEGVNDIKADCDGMLLMQRVVNPITGESTIIVTPDENKARAGQNEQAFRFAAKDQETEYEELVYSLEELTPEQMEREKGKLHEQNMREAYKEEIDMIEYFLRKNPASVQSVIVKYWYANKDNYTFGRPRLMNALKALTGICWTVKKGSNNSKIYSLSI